MAVMLQSIRAGRSSFPQRSLVLIWVRRWVDLRAMERMWKIRAIGNSSYLIGNRNRNLSANILILQPPTLPRALWSESKRSNRQFGIIETHKVDRFNWNDNFTLKPYILSRWSESVKYCYPRNEVMKHYSLKMQAVVKAWLHQS
jgi:hypothetical protein